MQGQYSLLVNSTTCYDCLANAECQGGHRIEVKPGYWRSSFYSEKIIQCFNPSACIGGTLPVDYSTYHDTNRTYPLCAEGYGGNLCHKC